MAAMFFMLAAMEWADQVGAQDVARVCGERCDDWPERH